MKLACPHCSVDISLEDSMPPEARMITPCSGCGQPIAVYPDASPSPPSASLSHLLEQLRDLFARPPEVLPQNSALSTSYRRRALLCLSNPKLRDEILASLGDRLYDATCPEDVLTAVEMLQTERADVLVVDPFFLREERGYEQVRQVLLNLHPKARRRIFVVLLSVNQRTLDGHAAFREQVNLIVNAKNLQTLLPLIERGIRSFNDFYGLFNHAVGAAPL